MQINGKTVLLCSCEGSMAIDADIVAKAADGAAPTIHHRLCGPGIETRIPADGPLLIACTQEAPMFRLAAPGRDLTFVNIRERAGWSEAGGAASPKIAALLAEAALPWTDPPAATLASDGATVILTADQTGLEVAERLAGSRPVTCLVVAGEDDLLPPSIRAFGLYAGHVATVTGHLGQFHLAIEDLRASAPSARTGLLFDIPVAAGALTAEILLDLTGRPSLFPAERAGYLRADPNYPAAVERALGEAKDLIGTFERPRYVRVEAERCAHARHGITGCTRCLDSCPTSAIRPAGDAVEIEAGACDGFGACAARCPTGAITWDRPISGIADRIRVLLDTYHRAGGANPRILIHTPKAGATLIEGLARFGNGLPATVLPLAIDGIAAFGPDLIMTALAFGATQVAILAPPEDDTALAAVETTLALVRAILGGDSADGRLAIIAEDDPYGLGDALAGPVAALSTPPADYLPVGRPRERLLHAIRHLRGTTSEPIALPDGAPFGDVVLDADACTLCMACVGGCPTGALGSGDDTPALTFQESACVQCGLCRATCPEKAIRLTPRLVLDGEAAARRVLKRDEPYRCIRCGAPFGTRSAIERMIERLADHPMFTDPGRRDLLRMCDPCRVTVQQAERKN